MRASPLVYQFCFSWDFCLTTFYTILHFTNIGERLLNMDLYSVQSFSHVQLFATPWTAASQSSLSITRTYIRFIEKNFPSWKLRFWTYFMYLTGLSLYICYFLIYKKYIFGHLGYKILFLVYIWHLFMFPGKWLLKPLEFSMMRV